MSDSKVPSALTNLLAHWKAPEQKTPGEIAQAFEPLDVCGGAFLRVSRAEAELHERDGVGFDTDPHKTLPTDGRGEIRVRCRSPILAKVVSEEIPGTEKERWKRMVKFGLCARCEGLEIGMRQKLRKEADDAAKAQRGPRKKGFQEGADE